MDLAPAPPVSSWATTSSAGGDCTSPPATEAFEQFFRDEQWKLIGFVMRKGATRHDAEDVVMNVMADIWEHWDRIESPRAYAYVAAERKHVKAQLRRRREVDTWLQEDEHLLARHSNPSRDLDDGLWVTELLRALPPAQREVMALTVDGVPSTEIAKRLATTTDTVRSNLRHARHRLAIALAATA